MALTVPALLAGSEAASLDRAGYRRAALPAFDLSLDVGFILDGELYRVGDNAVRAGAPTHFAVPFRPPDPSARSNWGVPPSTTRKRPTVRQHVYRPEGHSG